MRILLQRVRSASVDIEAERVAEIGQGLLLLCGFGAVDREDWPAKTRRAADKMVNLRVFTNHQGKLDQSVIDLGGSILVVPQFTLYGKSLKGRRPDFTDALAPSVASTAFDGFRDALAHALGKPVQAGVFGADMQVALINDGPMTLSFEF